MSASRGDVTEVSPVKIHKVVYHGDTVYAEVTCKGYGPDIYRDSDGKPSVTMSARTNLAMPNNIGLGLDYAKCMATAWAEAARLLELKLAGKPTGNPVIDEL